MTYLLPPPRRPQRPWWRSRPAALVYLVVLLSAEYLIAYWALESIR